MLNEMAKNITPNMKLAGVATVAIVLCLVFSYFYF